MEEVFKYIIGLGAAVMMPIIFTILGVCIGIKLPKALKSGLLVGVGFVGLSVVTALLTSSLGPALSKMVEIYGLELGIFDMGWPSAAAVAYNTIPQPFCQSFVPFAIVINKLLDKIPGFDKLNIDSEGMKKKVGLMGEPLFLGIVIGCGIGALGCASWKEVLDNIPGILGLGIKMGAVMELIPRITSLFIEGLKPISDATRELIAKKYKNNTGLSIGMSPALVIGHPTTLVVSLLLIPVTIFLAVILPGNRFLPLASLAGMFYLFPMILPITKGNVVKSFIIGLVALIVGLYFVTGLAGFFTLAAKDVYEATGDPTVNIPAGFEGGALDFASSLFCWGIFHLTYSLKIIGPAILVALALGMAIYNRIRMTRNDAKNALNSNKE